MNIYLKRNFKYTFSTGPIIFYIILVSYIHYTYERLFQVYWNSCLNFHYLIHDLNILPNTIQLMIFISGLLI